MLAGKPLTVEKAELICKWYFRAGFALLPGMWLLLWLFFRHHEEHSEFICWYVRTSKKLFLGSLIAVVVMYVMTLLLLPSSSSQWVIPPFTGVWHAGIFSIERVT